jgi:predicted CXXCH cytochrome family protein
MNASLRKKILIVLCLCVAAAGILGVAMVRRGFSAKDEPSAPERIVARFVRNLSIPRSAAAQRNPLHPSQDVLQEGRNAFMARCASCHGIDGRGKTTIGRNLYPKPPDLIASETQNLSDGQIHYIIENGVRLTGMPAWGTPHEQEEGGLGWKLVLFIRDLRQSSPAELQKEWNTSKSDSYIGSTSCQKCHAEIYKRWQATPMANVVRDPREHPEAIIPDLATNPFQKFTKDQVALVYGHLWKQRYFTKVGEDYFPQPSQWDIAAKTWRPYFVANGTDWWASLYPPDNFQRPTGPTCDGCHSVGYDIQSKKVAEWNVGCERCHGPGSKHASQPSATNILNPARMDFVMANDTCIQCHSQGRPLHNPIEGKYFDWPVGYRVGLNLADFWQLEEHTLGQQTFTHFPDGTAHKNRMQGNDFVQSVMYRHGVTCFSCHDVHGTQNYAQLRKPADKLCLDCHGPMSPNGPRAATLALHTHHKDDSPGSQCIACHMPKIEVTIADTKVRAHTFAFIYPSMTDKYKVQNPCTICHADKSTSWAADAMRTWSEYSSWRMP